MEVFDDTAKIKFTYFSVYILMPHWDRLFEEVLMRHYVFLRGNKVDNLDPVVQSIVITTKLSVKNSSSLLLPTKLSMLIFLPAK